MNIIYSRALQTAIANKAPLVALESTIITHGMPYPQNVNTAKSVEAIVKNQGAEPATIAVLNGNLHVGLEDNQLDDLGQIKGAMKLSRADFAFAIAQKKTGSTTVAATMIAADLAGIKVFATGGIGGVHRGAEYSFDISADLEELANTNIIVVCAGAKAILDLPKTLEILETKGVPVIAYGTDELPAFWSRNSGLDAPLRLDTPQEIANHAATRLQYGIHGGTLIANPVPKNKEITAEKVNQYIDAVLNESDVNGIQGKNVTPFLLQRMFELTNGESLETNIALIENNAKLAAQIAVAIG